MAVTTTALVLESNGATFFRGNNVLRAGSDIGLTMPIPTPDGGGTFEGDFWASPINDSGVVTGITFSPYNLNSGLPAKPNAFSVPAVKIRWQGVGIMGGKPDYWFVLGTSTQWAAGSLPTASSLVYWPARQGARPVVNATTGVAVAGSFEFTLGIPSLSTSPSTTFYPVAYYNGVQLATSTTNGYANTTTLLSFMNTNYGTIGSPSITIVWALSSNGSSIKGTFTDNSTPQNDVPFNDVLEAWIFPIV